jgi:molybdenum cofactor biosynthesis enzyme
MLCLSRGATRRAAALRPVQRDAFGTLTHLAAAGRGGGGGDTAVPAMVDVSGKAVTRRVAVAEAFLTLPPAVAAAYRAAVADGSKVRVGRQSAPGHGHPHPSPSPTAAHALTRPVPSPARPPPLQAALFSTAVTAGVLGAKATPSLIPMCHPLPLSKCGVDITEEAAEGEGSEAAAGEREGGSGIGARRASPASAPLRLRVACTAVTSGQTGVEMEALCGASLAALTLYDMLKGAAPAAGPPGGGMVITGVRVVEKRGGKSGDVVA